RPQRDGSFIMADGFLEPFQPGERKGEALMRVRGAFLYLECPAEQPRCFLELALLQSKHTQATKRPEMTRVRPEHRIVDLLRLPQPTLGMERRRLLEGLQRTPKPRVGQGRCFGQDVPSPGCFAWMGRAVVVPTRGNMHCKNQPIGAIKRRKGASRHAQSHFLLKSGCCVMPRVRFKGRVLPAALSVSIPNRPTFNWKADDLGLDMTFHVRIQDGSITIDCNVNKFEEDAHLVPLFM